MSAEAVWAGDVSDQHDEATTRMLALVYVGAAGSGIPSMVKN